MGCCEDRVIIYWQSNWIRIGAGKFQYYPNATPGDVKNISDSINYSGKKTLYVILPPYNYSMTPEQKDTFLYELDRLISPQWQVQPIDDPFLQWRLFKFIKYNKIGIQ